jgi:hypothetical protein
MSCYGNGVRRPFVTTAKFARSQPFGDIPFVHQCFSVNRRQAFNVCVHFGVAADGASID